MAILAINKMAMIQERPYFYFAYLSLWLGIFIIINSGTAYKRIHQPVFVQVDLQLYLNQMAC